eukprot:TRINITY_DN3655_c0_g1_i1.p1 TRINITY_DN3655_c0_g1~~TRINITY_DN3655_c0_g1_i1.p1  ORF type:complete len:886 (-),score=354.06 TRINITY_DN3655_c0_g1_i1:121-2778(-)
MDAEDFEDLGLGKDLVANDRYQSMDKEGNISMPMIPSQSAVQGLVPSDLFFVPKVIPIGQKLLRLMGWREGQGVGPRIKLKRKKRRFTTTKEEDNDDAADDEDDPYARQYSFPPADVPIADFAYKGNMYGVGYDPYINAPEFRNARSSDSNMDKTRGGLMGRKKVNSLFQEKTVADDEGGFGMGLFEDNDDIDIYAGDDVSKFDSNLVLDDYGEEDIVAEVKPSSTKGKGDSFPGFVKSTRPPPAVIEFPPPELPQGYKPKRMFQDRSEFAPKQDDVDMQMPSFYVEQSKRTSTSSSSSSSSLPLNYNITPSERGYMLGEQPLQVGPSIQSKQETTKHPSINKDDKEGIFGLISAADRKRIEELTGKSIPIPSNQQDKKPQTLAPSQPPQQQPQPPPPPPEKKPYSSNPQKQKRFELWLKVQRGQADPGTRWNEGLNSRQSKDEHDEFMREWGGFKVSNSTVLSNRFVSTTIQYEPGEVSDEDEDGKKGDYQVEDYHTTAASMGMFGALTRSVVDWYPAPLLCKRFNVAVPHRGSRKDQKKEEEINAERERIEKEWQEMMIKKKMEEERQKFEELRRREIKHGKEGDDMKKEDDDEDEDDEDKDGGNQLQDSKRDNIDVMEQPEEQQPQMEEEEVLEKPSLDLFKAIFEDSDEEEDDEDKQKADDDVGGEEPKDTNNDSNLLEDTTSSSSSNSTFSNHFLSQKLSEWKNKPQFTSSTSTSSSTTTSTSSTSSSSNVSLMQPELPPGFIIVEDDDEGQQTNNPNEKTLEPQPLWYKVIDTKPLQPVQKGSDSTNQIDRDKEEKKRRKDSKKDKKKKKRKRDDDDDSDDESDDSRCSDDSSDRKKKKKRKKEKKEKKKVKDKKKKRKRRDDESDSDSEQPRKKKKSK